MPNAVRTEKRLTSCVKSKFRTWFVGKVDSMLSSVTAKGQQECIREHGGKFGLPLIEPTDLVMRWWLILAKTSAT